MQLSPNRARRWYRADAVHGCRPRWRAGRADDAAAVSRGARSLVGSAWRRHINDMSAPVLDFNHLTPEERT